jgi:hypothetical protein
LFSRIHLDQSAIYVKFRVTRTDKRSTGSQIESGNQEKAPHRDTSRPAKKVLYMHERLSKQGSSLFILSFEKSIELYCLPAYEN